MKTNISVLFVGLLIGVVIGGPVADPLEVVDIEAGTRDETGSLTEFVAELRDSLVVPILLNPFQVNKLTCGSIITFYDNSSSDDVTVAVDLCLTALLLAKLLVIVPMILSNMDVGGLEGGVFGIFDRLGESLARLDLAGSGPEGEPIETALTNAANKYGEESPEIKESLATSMFGIFDKLGESLASLTLPGSGPEGEPIVTAPENAANKYSGEIPQIKESLATYDEQGYVGFGFDGWQSGVQSFPDINQVNEFTTNYLPRSFPTGKLEKLLTSSLHGLEHAISVEKKN